MYGQRRWTVSAPLSIKLVSTTICKTSKQASKDIDLEVNSEKTKYMITSRLQNVLQNQNIVIGNLSFENVQNFRYLGETVTNTNDTREEIKRRINMGNACYYLLEKISSFRLLSKKLKVKAGNPLRTAGTALMVLMESS